MDKSRIEQHIVDIRAELAAQHQCLKEHMRRTEISERRLLLMEDTIVDLTVTIWFAKGAIALFSFLSCVGGMMLTLKQFL